jgi:CubicO group peptidase (beta-lactamase class C family)
MTTPIVRAQNRSEPITQDRPSGLVRWAQRAGLAIMALALLLGALYLVARLTTEYSFLSREIVWGTARFDDFTRFPQRPIPKGAVTYQFQSAPATVPSYLTTATYEQDGRAVSTPLAPLLASAGTRAFLVLKGDQLLYEGYFNGADRTSTVTSFSIAKSFDSALVGIAIDEGYIHSVDDPITRYLPNMASHPGLDQVTIRDLLTMTSGIRWIGPGSNGGMFDDASRNYYETDLRKYVLSLPAAAPPDSRFQYNSYNPVLLGLILERATGRNPSTYLSEKLWQPLGMEAPGSWSLDSRHDGFEKMEDGINGRAIDFARFGELYLNGGVWQGQQLVPQGWVAVSTQHDPVIPGPSTAPADQPKSRALSTVLNYGYLWWLDKQAPGRFAALGNLGQYIYVAPDRDVVVVRFGTQAGSLDDVGWVSLFRNLASAVP